MKISQIIIKKSIQFEDCVIDLTYPQDHPKAGQPLEKVCFIGQNGTGKTRLLELIGELFYWVVVGGKNKQNSPSEWNTKNKSGFFLIKYQSENQNQYFFKLDASNGVELNEEEFYRLTNSNLEIEKERNDVNSVFSEKAQAQKWQEEEIDIENDSTICAYVKVPDFFTNVPSNNYDSTTSVPKTQLSIALNWLKEANFLYHRISPQYKNDFWALLISTIKQKESLILQALQKDKKLSYEMVLTELDKIYPSILEKVAQLWDKILAPLNLYFDIENATIPVQLTDNLLAYIKHKKDNRQVPYHLLSTGIQNFIFNIGHLLTAHFYNQDKNSLVLVDEPEDSLHPKFLYGLIDLYKEITGGEKSQLFVATHSELIAAQFEPYERVILDFDPDKIGEVIIRKGVAPKGQNAADLLMNDFGTTFYQHEDAEKAFEHFLELKNLIRNTENEAEKLTYAEEAENLAFKYKFPTFQKRQKN